jgi:lysophospholipase L1-like esterase
MTLPARLRSPRHCCTSILLLLLALAAAAAVGLSPAALRAADGGAPSAKAAPAAAAAVALSPAALRAADGSASGAKAAPAAAARPTSASATAPGSMPSPVHIACIGDSITQGRQGGGSNAPVYSYRYDLWKKFIDAAIPVDFVGSMNGGFEGDPSWPDYLGHAFDRDHEGHWGWTTTAVADNLTAWTATYPAAADIALVLLGTNDMSGGASTPMQPTVDAMTRIIATMRSRNPRVVVIIGQCYQAWDPFPGLRAAMVTLAAAQTTAASPVVTVDHSPGWVSDPANANTDTVDWVHPNQKGDTKLSANWFAAIQPFLTPDPPVKKKTPEATLMLMGQ